MSPETTPVNGERISPRDRIAAALRGRITSGELRPGARLPTQQHLEAEFGVRRTVVRQALEMLKNEGLVSMGRGAPATVSAPDQHPAALPRPASVELVDRLTEAFRAEHVTVDAFSLTTETLNNAMAQVVTGIDRGELTPRSITMRVMIPSYEAHLAVPQLVSDPHDNRPLDRLHRLMRTYADALHSSLEALTVRGLVPEVSLTVKTVPVTPLHKLYLLNRHESLIGYYQVTKLTVGHDEGSMEIYDVLGLDATLFYSSSGPDRRDEQEAAFVEVSQLWFESLWSTIARPFTLD